ncbi:BTB/POZ domain-containing protein [Phthorimaea operculella]|nr:BTB/POZ domain-containing protein [Phthorimaea operculella]
MATAFNPENIWEWLQLCVLNKNAMLLLMRLELTNSTAIENLVKHFINGPYKMVFNLKRERSPITYHHNLYYDNDLMDFELRTCDDDTDSGVHFHKNVMAFSSPVLKEQFLGEWKNSNHGYVQLTDSAVNVSKVTLQQLKDYIYLHKTPQDSADCVKLMNLATYYKMPELERDAAEAIADNLKPENLWEWFAYCVEQKNEYLLVAMLTNIYERNKIDAIKKYFSEV